MKPIAQEYDCLLIDLDGTVFTEGTMELGPTSTFARALLGSVGEVTKERMDQSPGKYQNGDQVGFAVGRAPRLDDAADHAG